MQKVARLASVAISGFFPAAVLAAVVIAVFTPPVVAVDPSAGKHSPPAKARPVDEGKELQYTSIEQLPRGVTLAALSNGLTVIVQENHVAPVATVRCFVKNTGSAFEGQHVGAGLSHVLEHVVAGGTTTKRTEKEISKIIDSFGGATNAFTSTEMTVFFIDCPAKQTMLAIELLADSMQRIKFEPSEFERELKVVRRELADDEVERGHVLYQLLNQTVYTVSPVRHPVIGYLPVLNRTTNQTIIDFYHHRYIPNNQIFVVVGDVRTAEVLDHVRRQWVGNPRRAETVIALPREPEQLTPRETIREMEGTSFDVILAWPTVELSHPDLYPLDVAAYILSQGESSRLVRSLKYERQLVLSIEAESYTPHFVRGWFGVQASVRPEQWKQAEPEILREVYRLRDALVDPAELAKAKKQKAAELVFDRQTVQQAADSLGRNTIAAADPNFDEHYVEGIQSVTAEQVRDVARRYFVPQRINRVIIAPPGGAPKNARQLAAAQEGPVRLERLPNGLRVLVKRLPNLPLVNIQAFVLGGSLVDTPHTAGRANLVSDMLDQGTARHSADEIAQYFDAVGGKLGIAAGRNTIYGSATVLRDDFPKAAALFAECFTQPTFPDDRFQKAKQLSLGEIARRNDDPHKEIFEFFADNLPEGSPYHVVEGGTAASVGRLTAADLRAYYARYFAPQNMVVTVFGDVDPAAALAIVRQNFAVLRRSADLPPVDFHRPNALGGKIVRNKKIGKPTAMILLGYPGPSIFDRQDYAAMTLLDAITSGYSYPSGWLHTELRGEGLVYFVHAFQMTGPAPGYFLIFSQTQPEKLAEVVQRIQRIMQRAKDGKIEPAEFRLSQQMVTAMHAQENTTIAEQARQAALDELYGLGYDYNRHFDERIADVKLEDVVRVANKYLNDYLLTTSSPEKTP
jgi:zinc protease